MVLKVKVISWPWPKVLYIWKLKLAMSESTLPIITKLYVTLKWKLINMMLVTWGHAIYGINAFFQEPVGRFDDYWYEAFETQAYYIFVQMITPSWPWPNLWHCQILQLRDFVWEYLTIMESLKIISLCDLEFGLYNLTKLLNEGLWVIKVKVCSAILTRFCMVCAYNRPRYQVSVNKTVGPLVFNFYQHYATLLLNVLEGVGMSIYNFH